jgi:hypothetical protein
MIMFITHAFPFGKASTPLIVTFLAATMLMTKHTLFCCFIFTSLEGAAHYRDVG